MLPDQAQQFLQHHGGDAAVEHKAELLQLSGGNVGKLEALGVKRCVCFFAEPFQPRRISPRT